jgi:hypothetical protein
MKKRGKVAEVVKTYYRNADGAMAVDIQPIRHDDPFLPLIEKWERRHGIRPLVMKQLARRKRAA